MTKITEYCKHCEEEVKIDPIMFIAQKCPKCGHTIKACSMCDCDICDCSMCERKWPSVIALEDFIKTPAFTQFVEQELDGNCTELSNKELAELAESVTPYVSDEDEELPTKALIALLQDKFTETPMLFIYHRFCEENHYDTWEDNGAEFFTTYFPNDPVGALYATWMGNYKYTDDFVRLCGDGCVESANSDEVYDEAIEQPEFVRYAFDNSAEMEDISEAEIDILKLAKFLIKNGCTKED